jgi:hypothetical protein
MLNGIPGWIRFCTPVHNSPFFSLSFYFGTIMIAKCILQGNRQTDNHCIAAGRVPMEAVKPAARFA